MISTAKKYHRAIQQISIEQIHKSISRCPNSKETKQTLQSLANHREERTCALESKMGNKKSEKATSRTAAKFKARLAAAAAQAKPSKAAGRAETKEAFNNYMERVIGKTFIILSTFDSTLALYDTF